MALSFRRSRTVNEVPWILSWYSTERASNRGNFEMFTLDLREIADSVMAVFSTDVAAHRCAIRTWRLCLLILQASALFDCWNQGGWQPQHRTAGPSSLALLEKDNFFSLHRATACFAASHHVGLDFIQLNFPLDHSIMLFSPRCPTLPAAETFPRRFVTVKGNSKKLDEALSLTNEQLPPLHLSQSPARSVWTGKVSSIVKVS